MSTAEDVFWLYERNKNYYANCANIGKMDTCPEKVDEKCYCHYNELVNPKVIGITDVKCSMKRKTYIKQGQECPICLDPIMRKSEAHLTSCGHGFHKLCMFKLLDLKCKDKKGSSIQCPICRCNGCLPCFPEKYNVFSFDLNELDKLEDFWNCIDYQMYYYCDNGHVEGTNKDCILCTNYRNFGNLKK
jgi:hypothetical protein